MGPPQTPISHLDEELPPSWAARGSKPQIRDYDDIEIAVARALAGMPPFNPYDWRWALPCARVAVSATR